MTTVTIPSGVTSIESSAFYNCSNLTSVTVENPTPITISSDVFNHCGNATLYVPYGTKEAYEAADVWKDFGNIIEVVIPTQPIIFADAYVKSLCVDNWDTNLDGELSFDEAAAVTNLSNNGVRVFADEQISLFDELQFFTGLTSIGEYDFSDCSSLMSITIPNSVTSIGQYAFSGCSDMTSINIPNSVTSIGEHAFSYCDGLTSITIPESVTSIGSSAFYECGGLTFITIPKKVTSIGEYAFFGCSDLTAVTVENPAPLTISANTFSNYDYASLYVPSGKKAAYEATEVWQDFGKIVPVVNVVENGNLEGEPSNNWSSFWVREWRTMKEPFLGPANIVADPTNASNHCIKVVVRSEAEAREAGNMIDDGNGNYAPYESVFFVQSKQKF